MLFDDLGETFTAYEANSLLPVLLLIDQTGVIRYRNEGVALPLPFWEEMQEIQDLIDELLENPPGPN